MKFEKRKLTDLHRCYATSSTIVDKERYILLATEGQGQCLSYKGDELKQEVVWDGPGGTMSMIPIPDRNGDFLAVQNFFPTFDSKEATIVWTRMNKEGKWETKTLFKLPYVHRFDILTAGDKHYFIGATLCTSKEFKEDWSDPGKIYVAEIPLDLDSEFKFKVIKEGLTKNHGYCRTNWNGKMSGLITSEEGVFLVTPPQKEKEEWVVEKILNRPTSDIAVVDIDEDGEDELITIEEFHGGNFLINKKIEGEYKVIYKYSKPMDFGHVVWGGKLRGIPSIIGGYRREAKELFVIQCEDKEKLTFKEIVIEKGVGPSNVAVLNDKEKDIIISANRELGEAALYFVTD